MFDSILKVPERHGVLSWHIYEESYEATCVHI